MEGQTQFRGRPVPKSNVLMYGIIFAFIVTAVILIIIYWPDNGEAEDVEVDEEVPIEEVDEEPPPVVVKEPEPVIVQEDLPYSTSISPEAIDSYKYYGCWKDAGNGRVFANYLRSSTGSTAFVTVPDCAQSANTYGSKYFGLQNYRGGKGECWYGLQAAKFDMYGPADNCTTDQQYKYGGAWSNAIYSQQ